MQFLPGHKGELGQVQARDVILKATQQAVTLKAAHEVRGAILPRRNFVVATVPVTMLDTLKKSQAVAFVHAAKPLKLTKPQRASESAARAIKTGGKIGVGVLIGIIDVGGFDFAHPDFIDKNGKTRFVSIWDQGSDIRTAPKPFNYGQRSGYPCRSGPFSKLGFPVRPTGRLRVHSPKTMIRGCPACGSEPVLRVPRTLFGVARLPWVRCS